MKFKLSEISKISNGKKAVFYDDGTVPVYGANGPIGTTQNSKYNVGDIVIGRVGANAGAVHRPISNFWASDNTMVVTPGERVRSEYLTWLLQKTNFNQMTSGSAQPLLNQDILNSIDFEIPGLSEQDYVISVIEPFENQMGVLTSINDNLLDLSMTHFERWLETTSSTNNVSLDEIATYKNGLAMQKFEPENDADSLPVLKIRELNQGFTDSSSNRARTDIDESVKVHDGDVIFSWSGTLLVDIWTGGPAGLNQHLFKVTSDAYPKWFYYMWTRYHLRQFQQIAAGKATTMGHIKRGDLKAANVIIPTDSEFVQLEPLLKPVVDAYIENGVEIKSLQTIRDQLLQKLLG